VVATTVEVATATCRCCSPWYLSPWTGRVAISLVHKVPGRSTPPGWIKVTHSTSVRASSARWWSTGSPGQRSAAAHSGPVGPVPWAAQWASTCAARLGPRLARRAATPRRRIGRRGGPESAAPGRAISSRSTVVGRSRPAVGQPVPHLELGGPCRIGARTGCRPSPLGAGRPGPAAPARHGKGGRGGRGGPASHRWLLRS